ncbi:uncharacterized protein LOC117566876 [Drosophila albomicans]|uniref:Uncharacterized protein LOC117566876 n=1 Tax=Drosophila albomicans TaxID=7291 RepID=A0A6P8WFF8_DROAB|nr:uncharacterized protein LOC117566876 [Drosophila albomicans]
MDAPINYWYLEHISSGKKIILQSGENTVGRHSCCKVVLPGNEFLSRMHAKLIVNIETGVVLEQMKSLNGVFINKALLKANTQLLNDGDRLGLGVEVDEPGIVPPNYAIFIVKQMCPTAEDVIQISDDEDDDNNGKNISKTKPANVELSNENANKDNENAHRALHLPILPEVKAEALLAATHDIENIFGEPDKELLESVLQINPYVFQKLNNKHVAAGPNNICNGDVIELNEDKTEDVDKDKNIEIAVEAGGNAEVVVEDKNEEAVVEEIVLGDESDGDYDENFAMSQAVLQEIKEDMDFEGINLSGDDVDNRDNDNLLEPIKMESDISKQFDENEIVIIDDDDEVELFTKVADWSSKLLSQNVMSQIYPMDNEENLGFDNIQEEPSDQAANEKSSKSSKSSSHSKDSKKRHRRKSSDKTATTSKSDKTKDKKSSTKEKSTTNRKRYYSSSTTEKSSDSDRKSQENTTKESSKFAESTNESTKVMPDAAPKTKSPRLMNRSVSCYVEHTALIPEKDVENPSLLEKINQEPTLICSSSTTEKSSDPICKPQETLNKESPSKFVEPTNEGTKELPSTTPKNKSPRLMNRSISCYVDRNDLIEKPPLIEKTNRGPTLITAPQLPKHRGKLRGVSAESKKVEDKQNILERQRSKDYQDEMKKKWYQKPKDQKIEYEKNKEKRREHLKKLSEKSKPSPEKSSSSSSELKRKHSVPKPSNSNRGDFLTKEVEPVTSAKRNKLDPTAARAQLTRRRVTLDCPSHLEDPPVQSKQPAERKDAESARNRRTCNRVTFAEMERDFALQEERNMKVKRNRRVRFNDNVQIRIIERVEGAIRKTKNIKDTNKFSLSTYAERREWALALGKAQNCNEFITSNILSWGNQWLSLRDPNEVAESDILLPIPTEFNTFKQYKETFVPLMKVELLTTIEREYKNSTHTYEVSLESFTCESTKSRPRYILITRCKNKPAKQFDLYTLSSDGNIFETFATMPRMRHIAGTIFELTFEILTQNINKEMLEMAKTLTIRPVVDNLRVELGAFSAVYQLCRSPLYRRILQPSENVLSFDKHILKDTEYKGFTKLNDHQIDICQSTWIRLIDDSTPSITLIQGPPGTGKSVVISNLTLQCMYGRSNRHLDRKILICAHSNTAVDNITMYLNRARNCMTHSQFRLLRFGRFDKIDSKVGEVSLDHLLNIEREEKGKRLTAENRANLMQQQEMLKAEIAELRQKNSASTSYLQPLLQSKERQLKTLNERLNPPLTPREEYELSKKYIQRANIVCTTLSSCVKLAYYIDYFDVCIIDEATQCTEPWTLLPLQFGVRGLVLVGDTQQLPATVLSQKAIDLGLGNSMFDRIQRNLTHHLSKSGKNHLAHTKVFKLSMQYRMHPEICRWPNSYFYHDQLVNADATKQLLSPIIPYCVINLSYTKDTNDSRSRSISNIEEAHFVAKLLIELKKHMPTTRYKYGLITPYSNQCSVLSGVIPREMMIVPNTVDAYQGQERDVIIISNARTRGVGFLTNYQRLNVAITRPRRCLIICGNFDDLKAVDMWRHLLDDARHRQIYFNLKKTDVEDLNRSLISKILVKPIEISDEPFSK